MADRRSLRRRKTARTWLAWLLGLYLVFAALNRYTPGYTECITDAWCLASRRDWWLLSLLQVSFLVLLLFAARLALIWALRMLASPRRHWWFLIFFVALGVFGATAWVATVPRADWSAFLHVPILAALLAALGVGMFFAFRPRPLRRITSKRQDRR